MLLVSGGVIRRYQWHVRVINVFRRSTYMLTRYSVYASIVYFQQGAHSIFQRRRYFRGWRLTFEWTAAASNGATLRSSSVTGFKSPLSPDDASPALLVTYQGKTQQLEEGKPLTFDDCPLISVALA